MLPVHRVPGRVLQPRINGFPAGDQLGVDLLNAFAGDQPQARVAGCGHQIEAAFVHERNHLVGGAGGIDANFAPGSGLEGGHPVVGLVGVAALDISGPGDNIHHPFAIADLLKRRRTRCRGKRRAERRDAKFCCQMGHVSLLSPRVVILCRIRACRIYRSG